MTLNSQTEPLPEVRRNLTLYKLHPQYTSHITGHDLALLKLKEPITFQPHIQPICLPEASETNLTGIFGTISGWGRLLHGGGFPSVLRKVRY